MVMDDKEVGELWQQCYANGWTSRHWNIANLIRKLVEERARTYYVAQAYPEPDTDRALHDFNIDPTTWPKE
jgi:hypothetical protein